MDPNLVTLVGVEVLEGGVEREVMVLQAAMVGKVAGTTSTQTQT